MEEWDGFKKLYSELSTIMSQDYYKKMNDDSRKFDIVLKIRRRVGEYLNQINPLEIHSLEKSEYNREECKLFDILSYKKISETELFEIIEYIFRFYKVKIPREKFLDSTREFLNEIENMKKSLI